MQRRRGRIRATGPGLAETETVRTEIFPTKENVRSAPAGRERGVGDPAADVTRSGLSRSPRSAAGCPGHARMRYPARGIPVNSPASEFMVVANRLPVSRDDEQDRWVTSTG